MHPTPVHYVQRILKRPLPEIDPQRQDADEEDAADEHEPNNENIGYFQ